MSEAIAVRLNDLERSRLADAIARETLAITPAERDLLVSALHLVEEHDGDRELTRPLLDLLERAGNADELRRASGAMVA